MSNGKMAREELIKMSPFEQLKTNFGQVEKVLSDMGSLLTAPENEELLKHSEVQRHLNRIMELANGLTRNLI
jgi:hypothetical protein